MDHADRVSFAREQEQLRQERETFEQAKKQDAQWFVLRLVMGYVAVVFLTAIMVVAPYVLFNESKFSTGVVAAAGAALFGDVLGLLIMVWKTLFNPDLKAQLRPVMRATLPETQRDADPAGSQVTGDR